MATSSSLGCLGLAEGCATAGSLLICLEVAPGMRSCTHSHPELQSLRQVLELRLRSPAVNKGGLHLDELLGNTRYFTEFFILGGMLISRQSEKY